MSPILVTIALPAELVERLDEFVAEGKGGREQVALKMLEWALFYSVTPSERAEMNAQFALMATDKDYQETIRQLEREGWFGFGPAS